MYLHYDKCVYVIALIPKLWSASPFGFSLEKKILMVNFLCEIVVSKITHKILQLCCEGMVLCFWEMFFV